MTVITNSDPDLFVTDDNVKQWFADETIDITGKFLRITRDSIGNILEIDVDVVLTAQQQTDFAEEFFPMSIPTIESELGILEGLVALLTNPPNATSYLTDQTPSSPAVIIISAADTLTDVSVTSNWNLGAGNILFTLLDSSTGEIRYDGTIPLTVKINYGLTFGVVSSFDNIYAALVRTPDGGSAAEIPGSRSYIETINGSDGISVSGCVTITLQPLDAIKLQVANDDGTTNIMVTVATVAIK